MPASKGYRVVRARMTSTAIPEAHVARLLDFDFSGTFEAHITVEMPDQRREDFRAACEALDVGCILIELAAGQSRSQPMTSSHHRGDLAEVLPQIDRIHAGLLAAGFPIVRVKLEAMAFNEGVPLTDLRAHDLTPLGAYFEFHAKLRLDEAQGSEAGLDELRALAVEHGAHLSRSDRRAHERFVTMRVRGLGRDSANARFERLVSTLREQGFVIGAIKRELTIYDSRESLDDGWLPSP